METKPESLEMDANCSTVEAKKHEMELGYVSETSRIKCWRYVVLQIGLSDNVSTIVSAYASRLR